MYVSAKYKTEQALRRNVFFIIIIFAINIIIYFCLTFHHLRLYMFTLISSLPDSVL